MTRGIFRQNAKYTRVQFLMDAIDKSTSSHTHTHLHKLTYTHSLLAYRGILKLFKLVLLVVVVVLVKHSCCFIGVCVKYFASGVEVKMYDCTIHEVGALLKTLLRNVPGGILQSSRYTEFVATNDCEDRETRIQQIQK